MVRYADDESFSAVNLNNLYHVEILPIIVVNKGGRFDFVTYSIQYSVVYLDNQNCNFVISKLSPPRGVSLVLPSRSLASRPIFS
jgi:hypothetical protein